jgi:hypothetical protein
MTTLRRWQASARVMSGLLAARWGGGALLRRAERREARAWGSW